MELGDFDDSLGLAHPIDENVEITTTIINQ
jgi:hypothetical protein